MDKQKIIKIAIAVIVGIFAIIYYFSSNNETLDYENILTNEAIVENKEEVIEEEVVKIKVYVTGEVNEPGVIELEEGARIEDAIEGAGGIKAEADLKDINLAYEVSDGEKIYIPNLLEVAEENMQESSTTEQSATLQSTSDAKVNINKATVTELTNVPGIGASTAEKIIEYRNQNAKFKRIEDIKNVSGIGDSKYEKMKDYICVK